MTIAYDELWAVSDLHMGGVRGSEVDFQIFDNGPRLALLIDHIARRRKRRVVLVLNGDVFDSLAEDIGGYVAPDQQTACRMMKRLYADPTFSPVWDSLAAFVARRDRHLVMVVGNHDIELALTAVQESLLERLTAQASDQGIRSRVHFAVHGEGYGCRVGPAHVFCTHGNEVDDWNRVDFDQLSQLSNAVNAGRRLDASKWRPSPGTRLVIDVMNSLKSRYPFIDLLKPMAASIALVLLTLDRVAFKNLDLGDAYPILTDWVRSAATAADRLGGQEGAPESEGRESLPQILGLGLRAAITQEGRLSAEDRLLEEAERRLHIDPETISGVADQETLGLWEYVGWIADRLPRSRRVHRALSDWLVDQNSAGASAPDSQFDKIVDRVGDRIDFVVTGHTHNPKAIPFDGGCYYNCGAWIRRLRLTEQVLANRDTFDEFLWPLLNSGSMERLLSAKIPGPNNRAVPLLVDRANVVHISSGVDGAVGRLLRVTQKGQRIELRDEESTEPFKVGLP